MVFMMTMAGGIYVAIRTVRIWLNKNERLCVGNRQNLTRTGNLPSRAYARSLSMYYPTIYGYHILGYMYFFASLNRTHFDCILPSMPP